MPVVSGALVLAGIQLVTSSKQGGDVAGLLGGVAKAARWWLSPEVPAIPDRRVGSATIARAGAAGVGLGSPPASSYPAPSTPALTPVKGRT